MTSTRRAAAAVLATTLMAAGCATPAASPSTPSAQSAPASPSITPGPAVSPVIPTDYSNASNWLSLPTAADKPVDIFYIYPTVGSKSSPSDPIVNTIDNASMRQGAQQALATQASALAPVGNLYAPYYRQAAASDILALPLAQQQQIESGAPKEDVFGAFEYYLEHDNNGRPFILLAHSQGSALTTFLLSEYMPAHPDVYKRMIAAYVIGYGITPQYLQQNPHLRFAERADDTGVVISWNTESPSFDGTNPVDTVLPSIAINPISWTRGTATASASTSLGASMPNSSGAWVKMANYADATVDTQRGVVKCSTCNPQALLSPSGIFPLGVFHPFDINLYYYDIQANAALRADAWLKARP